MIRELRESRIRELRESGPSYVARMGVFYLAVLAYVGILVALVGEFLLMPFVAWFDPSTLGSHFVHDVAFMYLIVVTGVAMLVQLYRPAERVAAMQIAVVVAAILTVGTLASSGFDPLLVIVDAPIALAALAHPARGELVRSDAVASRTVSPAVVALVALALVPVALYAAGQLNLQATLADEHAALGHYAGMATLALSIVAVGLLAAVGGTGRRAAAYAAGSFAVVLGAASLFQPAVSALDGTWSVLAILWGLALVAAFEWSVRSPAARGEQRPVDELEEPPAAQ